ncbi:MAG TPA: hypothetical protein VF974_07585 [Patescibacteria group bacterium]
MTDEQQIEQAEVKSEAKEEVKEEAFTNRQEVLTPLDDINYHRMADTLDIDYSDRKIPHIQEKIAFLTDWAKQETKSDDRLTQALAIKDLCKRLGLNITGKEMVTKLYKWSYLDLQRRRIELQQQLI